MWWLALTLICAASIYTAECNNESISDEEFKSMLHDAAVQVFEQHSEVVSNPGSPPYFKMSENFMRSFVPGTGVGNREELIIEGLSPLPVFSEITPSRLLFKHFNNTDYVAGIYDNYMALLKINKSTDEYLTLSVEDIVLSSHVESGLIKDVVLFTRIVEYTEIFSVAVLTEKGKTSIVYIYEVMGDIGMVVATIDLNIDPTSSSVKKIGYVQSSYGGSLVVLTSHGIETGLVYNQRGHSKLNHYIQVNYPSAVDLLTFTIQGHGYIAVANGEFCEVFKMDEFAGSHIPFDRLGPFSGIVDLEYFRLGFHHFLAVADSSTQSLYTWKKGEFSSKQKMAIPNTAQIFASTVESCRDEVMLVTISWNGEIALHVFSGETEEFTKFDAAVPEGYSVKPSSLASFTYLETVVLLFVNLQDQLQAIVIKTSLKPLKDPLLVQGEEVSKLMKQIQDEIDSQKKEMKRIKALLKSAVRSTGTQHITSVQHFDDISATNGTVVELVNKFFLEWEDSTLTVDEYRQGTEDLRKNVESLEKLVMEIEQKIPDIVRLDEDAVVTGQKIFTGDVKAETLKAISLNLHKVAGVDLPKLQNDVYRLDKPQIIEGTLTFKEPLTVTGNLDVETTVNGIDFSEDVMTTDTEQESNAEMTFTNAFMVGGNLDVSGRINGIDISEEVVTLDGVHHIYAPKNFLNGIQAEDVNTRLLDGIDIDDLYKRAFTVSGDQAISSDAAFSTITTNNIVLNGNLNGYDVNEIEKNVVRIDRPATILGYKTFTNDVKIDSDLTVHGTINGLKIPDDLVITDQPQVITGTKEFVGQVFAHTVNVQGKVDGIKIPEDVVTLSKDEEISSTLYFVDGIAAEKDIIVEGLVDGVDISEIAKQAMKLDDSHTFQHAVFLGPVTITGDLNVKGLVNQIDLSKLLGDIVFKDEKPVEILSTKRFKQVTASKVKLDRLINGFNINVDFMKVHGDQIINGTKTFKNVKFNSINIDDGMIDGLNLADLYQNRITISIEEGSPVEEIEFVDHVIVGDLTVHGTIDDLRIPQDIVLRNSNQSISNKHFAGRVKVDNLIIDGDISVGTFSGIDLNRFYNERITLSGDQEIPGDIWLENTEADKVSISGLVNGVDITEFAKNVMSKSKPHQVVTASKEFSGSVSVLGDVHTKVVNGFDLSDIKRRAFKLLEDNIVTAPLEFDEDITFSDLVVKGDINGVNITRLNEDSLKKSGLQYVKGDTVFQAGFDVAGNILATKVNDLVLAQDILLKTVPQTINGQFTFGSLNIDGDLAVTGLINGLNLSEVAPKLARIDGTETVIESDITFTSSVHVLENIEVTGMVNEVNLKNLIDNVLRKTGNQTITGSKVFKGNVTIIGDIDAEYVNGINWKNFLNDVVWINIPQVIQSSKTFTEDVYIQEDMFVSGLAHVELINGKDLQQFVDEAVFIDQPANITGPIIFKNPVEITGDMNADLINGLRLQTDVITITCTDDGPQRITGQKTFQNLKVFGDIYTDTVNSYDLQELYEDTLLTEGNQIVKGRKAVYGDVVFKKDVYPDTVNGMVLHRDLVTLHTEQKIEGPVIFQEDIYVEKDMLIDGLLNGVDLQNLSSEAVYLKTDQVIEGTYSIENAVVLSNVEVSGTVNDVDLPLFDSNVTKFLADAKSSIEIMDRYAEDHCQLAKYLQETLKNSYYALDNFVLYQDLNVAASFIQVRTEVISLVYVDDFGTTATSVESVWDNSTKQFLQSGIPVTSSIVKSFSYKLGRVDFTINIGINGKDSSLVVEVPGSPVNLQSGFTDASVVLGETDAVIALLFPDKNNCEIYLLKLDPKKGYSFDHDASLDVGKEATSIVLFEISTDLYLAISTSHSHVAGSQVYAKRRESWRIIQRIQTSGTSVKHFEYHNYHYLAFVNDAPVYETKEPKSIQIFRNSGTHDSVFILFQKVPFDDARGIEVFQFGDLLQLHLITWNEARIQIFGLEGESGMNSLLTIYGNCIRDVKPLFIGDDLYLIIGQQNLKTKETVTSLVYKGITKGSKYKPYTLGYC